MNKVISIGLSLLLLAWNYANIILYGRLMMNCYGSLIMTSYLFLCCMGCGCACIMFLIKVN